MTQDEIEKIKNLKGFRDLEKKIEFQKNIDQALEIFTEVEIRHNNIDKISALDESKIKKTKIFSK